MGKYKDEALEAIKKDMTSLKKETNKLAESMIKSYQTVFSSLDNLTGAFKDITKQTSSMAKQFDKAVKSMDALVNTQTALNSAAKESKKLSSTMQTPVTSGTSNLVDSVKVAKDVAAATSTGIKDGAQQGSKQSKVIMENFFSTFFGRNTDNYMTFVGKAIDYYNKQLLWYVTKNISTATIAVPGQIIQAYAELNQGLKDIASVAQLTDEQMVGLGNTIISVATSTKFSVSEVASATLELAKAGLSMQEIQNSLEGLARLATATGSDITQASGLIVTALRAFDISSAETARVVDYMANAVVNSRLDIESLATGFSYIASSAAQANIPIEEVVAQLGILSNSGLRASTAATGLRMAILKLVSPSDDVKQVLSSYGITLDQVNPRFNSMADILDRLKNISQGDLVKIFTVRSANSIIALANAGGDALREMEVAVTQSGTTARLAEEQLLGLTQGWKNFLDTLEATAAQIGAIVGTDINDTLRGMQIWLSENSALIVYMSKQLITLLGFLIKFVAIPLAITKVSGKLVSFLNIFGAKLRDISFALLAIAKDTWYLGFTAGVTKANMVLNTFLLSLRGATTFLGPWGTAIAIGIGALTSVFALHQASIVKLRGEMRNLIAKEMVDQEKIASNINKLLQHRVILEGQLSSARKTDDKTSVDIIGSNITDNVEEVKQSLNKYFTEIGLTNDAQLENLQSQLRDKLGKTYSGTFSDVISKLAVDIKTNTDVLKVRQAAYDALLSGLDVSKDRESLAARDTQSPRSMSVAEAQLVGLQKTRVAIADNVAEYKRLLLVQDEIANNLKDPEQTQNSKQFEALTKQADKTAQELSKIQQYFLDHNNMITEQFGISANQLTTTLENQYMITKNYAVDVDALLTSINDRAQRDSSKYMDILNEFNNVTEINNKKTLLLSEGQSQQLMEIRQSLIKEYKALLNEEKNINAASTQDMSDAQKRRMKIAREAIEANKEQLLRISKLSSSVNIVSLSSDATSYFFEDKTSKADKAAKTIDVVKMKIAELRNELALAGKEDLLKKSLADLNALSAATIGTVTMLKVAISELSAELDRKNADGTDTVASDRIRLMLAEKIQDAKDKVASNEDALIAIDNAIKIHTAQMNLASQATKGAIAEAKDILPAKLSEEIKSFFNYATTVLDSEADKFIQVVGKNGGKVSKAILDKLSISKDQASALFGSGDTKGLLMNMGVINNVMKALDYNERKSVDALRGLQTKLGEGKFSDALKRVLGSFDTSLEEFKTQLDSMIENSKGATEELAQAVKEIMDTQGQAAIQVEQLNLDSIFQINTPKNKNYFKAEFDNVVANIKADMVNAVKEMAGRTAAEKTELVKAIGQATGLEDLKTLANNPDYADLGKFILKNSKDAYGELLGQIADYTNYRVTELGTLAQVAELEGNKALVTIENLKGQLKTRIDAINDPAVKKTLQNAMELLNDTYAVQVTKNEQSLTQANVTMLQNSLSIKQELLEKGLTARQRVAELELEILEKQYKLELEMAERNGVSKNDVDKKYSVKRQEIMDREGNDVRAGLKRGLTEWIQTNTVINNSYVASIELTKSALDSVSTELSGALLSIADGTKNVSNAFKDMARNILRTVAQMMVQEGVRTLLGVLASSLTSKALVAPTTQKVGGQTIATDYAVFAANGMPNVKGGWKAFANGTPVISKPTLGLVGEGRYNEAIIPLPDGKSVPVVMRGSEENKTPNVTIQVINQTTQEVTATTSAPKFDGEKYIVDVILKNISTNGQLRTALGVKRG